MISKSDPLDLPEILDIPDKLLKVIDKFNDYRYFLIEGGRVSGKSQSVGRFLLFLAEERKVRICCGREIQKNIDESVYTLLVDIITEYNLDWIVQKTSLEHRQSGSLIIFRGFREQGKLNIKGLEGVDILWIDEAQAITKPTLQVIIPTVRGKMTKTINKKTKIFFTMNRTLEDDAVFKECESRKDCLHIHINYYENKHCPSDSTEEAENMKTVDIDSYNHIWLGQPLLNASNFIFPAKLITHLINRFDTLQTMIPVDNIGVSVDPSGMGSDDNEFLAINDGLPLERFKKTIMSPGEKAMKAVELCKKVNGWWIIVDCDGIGADTFLELQSFDDQFLCGIQLVPFCGSAPSKVSMTKSLKKNRPIYENIRAEAAFVAQKRAYAGIAALDPKDKYTIDDLKHDVSFVNRQGLLQLVDKKDIKVQLKRSPGGGDTWKMAQYACSLNIKDQTFRMARQAPLQRVADTNYDTDPASEYVSNLQQQAD